MWAFLLPSLFVRARAHSLFVSSMFFLLFFVYFSFFFVGGQRMCARWERRTADANNTCRGSAACKNYGSKALCLASRASTSIDGKYQ